MIQKEHGTNRSSQGKGLSEKSIPGETENVEDASGGQEKMNQTETETREQDSSFYLNLNSYLENNYVDQVGEARDLDLQEEKAFLQKSPDHEGEVPLKDLDELMQETGETFHQMLFRLIDEKELKDSEVYRRAKMDRRLFAKIRANPLYHPRKSTILVLAAALQLTVSETEELLASAEFAFSPGSRSDLIVKYCLEHSVYDILTINQVLQRYGLPELG